MKAIYFSMEAVMVCGRLSKRNFLDSARDGNSISFINKFPTKSVVGVPKAIHSKS